MDLSKDKYYIIGGFKMKGKITSFAAGMLTAVLLMALTVPALAAGEGFTLTVSPIKLLVNGAEFKPKDVNGNDVLVFVYNGTTYAPVRALAEAFGLEVGYDGNRNMATVNKPSAAPAESTDFSSMWTLKDKNYVTSSGQREFAAYYSGPMSMDEFKAWWKSTDMSVIMAGAEQMAEEARKTVPEGKTLIYFSFNPGSYPLGNSAAEESHTGSNFEVAKAWIK